MADVPLCKLELWHRAPALPHSKGALFLQVTHWHSPFFFAYFPTASSYPAMLADMLCGAIGCIGFSWVSVCVCVWRRVVLSGSCPPHVEAGTGRPPAGGVAGEEAAVFWMALLVHTLLS